MKLLPYEIWRDIPGFEGEYQASSMGNIRSVGFVRDCYDINNSCFNGKVRHIKGKDRRPAVRGKNKDRLGMTLAKNGVLVQTSIARLVALTFIPNPNNLPEVNHKDENPKNNQVSNLEWCDRGYNNNYGTRNKRVAEKLSRPIKQLTLSGELIRVWVSQQEIQRRTNYQQSCISDCCRGKQKTAYGYKWEFYEKGN